MAFDASSTDTSALSALGESGGALTSSGQEPPSNGTWRSRTTGLVPIDETLEDLYTEVKRCDPERACLKAKFIQGRSRSKSLNDLLAGAKQNLPDRAADATHLSLSLDSLSQLTHVSCYASDVDSDPEFYERLDHMYSDVALAHARARAQLYQDLQQELDTVSSSVTPLSSPYIHRSPIDAPFEMTLLDNEEMDIAL